MIKIFGCVAALIGLKKRMQWMEAKITFSSDNAALAVDLIADVFYGLNAKGVVIDDPLLEPEESWAPVAIERPSRPAVTGYLVMDDQYETRRHALEQSVGRLAGDHVFDHTITYQLVDEEDWAESWKAFFWPQEITSRMVVKPTWRDYVADPDQLVIEIDPGMAFGTGTHPTTSLCIQLLENYLRSTDAVLDVGTGSGILLIAAAKLGASYLVGIDSDAMAVDVARKNLTQNNIDMSSVSLMCADLVSDVTKAFEVVVANILAEVILGLLDDVVAVVKPGGLFICSGIIKSMQSKVAEKMTSCGFDVLEQRQEGDWVALVGQRPVQQLR
jgi:ribosomal protein L11 methyltransferase